MLSRGATNTKLLKYILQSSGPENYFIQSSGPENYFTLL